MNTPPSLPPTARRTDEDHLRILAIFHFVVAGLALFGIGFLVLHYQLMSGMMSNPQAWQPQGTQGPSGPPPEFFNFFRWFYVFMGVMLVLGSVANLISGVFLRRRKNRLFSMVVAGLNCLQVPFGTVLGIFTILVLVRPSVMQLYEEVEQGTR